MGLLPEPLAQRAREIKSRLYNRYLDSLPRLAESDIKSVLLDNFNIGKGDLLFVTSSTKELRLGCSLTRLLEMLREAVGQEGTILMPTYPKGPARGLLERGEIFDVKKTPSMTGLLTELFRRLPGARRSLHPTKAVSAIGPLAGEMTADHHRSPHPYGAQSPYFRLTRHENAKIIGLGVTSTMITIVHAVEDFLGDEFPVQVNDPRLFTSRCIDASGGAVSIKTYAHSNKAVEHDIPKFNGKHLKGSVRDFSIKKAPFFIAQAKPAFAEFVRLARQGITIYT